MRAASDLGPDDRPPKAAVAEFERDDPEPELQVVHHFVSGIAAQRKNYEAGLLDVTAGRPQKRLDDSSVGVAQTIFLDAALRLLVDQRRIEDNQVEVFFPDVLKQVRSDDVDLDRKSHV